MDSRESGMIAESRAALIMFAHGAFRRVGWRLIWASMDLLGRKGAIQRLAPHCARLSNLSMRGATWMERRGWVVRLVDGRFLVRA